MFINELELRGYEVLRSEDNFLLSSNSFKKTFSTWGLIFVVKEIKLVTINQNLVTYLSLNIPALITIYLCGVGACIAMVLREPNYGQTKIILPFLFLLVIMTVILFCTLRSDILKDIKKSIKQCSD